MIQHYLLSVKAYFSSERAFYQSIKNIFGFYPENIFLYKLAFRHRSAAIKKYNGLKLNNERLEYLGDAILGAIVAEYLFKKFPLEDEGFLTGMRSKIVNRIALNKLSQKLGLDALITADTDTNKQFKSINGDAFEAFVGALYLDKGHRFTKKILIERIIMVHFNLEELQFSEINHKSALLEYCQKEKLDLEFKVINELGTGYKKQFEIQVLVDGVAKDSAIDFSIKGAEKLAAEKVYHQLVSETSSANNQA
ncbi:MAG: ribonuclease III [Bacteroidales bacterium]|nr:ribonuclease III [Bacteroidales bacterium]